MLKKCIPELQTHSPTVANTPASNTPSISLSPNLQRKNFSGIQPWDREPRGTESYTVDEGKRSRRSTVLWCLVFVLFR